MKQRIEYLIAALILAVAIAVIISFWILVLFGLLWFCAEWPTVAAWSVFSVLLFNFLKQLAE